MIKSQIVLADPLGGANTLEIVIPLAAGHGDMPEIAHELLVLCITAAERPDSRDIYLPLPAMGWEPRSDSAPWTPRTTRYCAPIEARPRNTGLAPQEEWLS